MRKKVEYPPGKYVSKTKVSVPFVLVSELCPLNSVKKNLYEP